MAVQSPLIVRFAVPGAAVGAARPRVVRLKNGASHTYMPDKPVAWEELCRQIAVVAHQGRPAVDVAVWVDATIWVSRPKRLRRKTDERGPIWATGKPDVDNAAKLVMDALTKAGVLSDDTKVAELTVKRLYLAIDAAGLDVLPERVEVVVGRCDEVLGE